MLSAYEAFYALWFTGDKQKVYLEKLGSLNNERKGIQDDMIKKGIEQLDLDQNILILCSEEYHEGIVGIVAGRLTEKYRKPSVVLKIDTEKGFGVASLRGPDYFSVIDMLYHVAPLLDRFGGHKQAGGLTVKLENLDKLVSELQAYCKTAITEEMMHKKTNVDTTLGEGDMELSNFRMIDTLSPFGEGNREPVLLLQDAIIKHKQTMGKPGKSHLKLYTQVGNKVVEVVQRNQGDKIEDFALNEKYDLVVSHRRDGDHWYLVGE
jgi:single-stranded-DNA-specific exonuclease